MSKKNSQGRNWVGIIAAILAFFIVLNVISYIWFPFLPWFEQRDAGQETVEQTYDAENAIQQYEEFRQMYHDIEAQRNQVENAYDEDESFHETYGDDPNNWSRTAETRHGRIHERITGNQNQLEQLVADYNAQSDMPIKSCSNAICRIKSMIGSRYRGHREVVTPSSLSTPAPTETRSMGAHPKRNSATDYLIKSKVNL